MKRFFIWLSQIEKRYRTILLFILAFLLYLGFYISLLEKSLINKIASYLTVERSNISDGIFGLIFLFSFVALTSKIYLSFWKKKPVFDDFTWLIFIVGFYSLHRFEYFTGSNWKLISFQNFKSLRYADGILLLILYFIYNAKDFLRRHKQEENVPELIEDDYFRKKGSDILKRNGYAGHIANLILQKQTNISFAIGIKGSWGSGKSVFLTQIENKLYNTIKIRFNPWLSKNTDEVLGDFFKILIEKTSTYDSGLSKSFRRYYTNLANIDENFGKKILSSIGLLKNNSDLSLEEQQRRINLRLKSKKLKIVVFIDDLDRLNAEEILSVLKLIRNSFNFPNTFFLIAYDEAYVRATLNKIIDHPEKFLEKIFQLEIDLPSFPNSLVQIQLTELLTSDKSEEQKRKITDAITILSEHNLLDIAIKNMRDAIRLSNSFNHIFRKKEKEVDHLDFLLLELIKLQDRTVYNDVRSALISNTSISFLQFPDVFKYENDPIKFSPTEIFNQQHTVSPILEMLFNREDNFEEVKTIRLVGNAIRYFSDDLFGNISYTDFEKYKDESFTDFKNLLDEHFEKKNIDELILKILRVNRFTGIHPFFNLNKALLYVCNRKSDYQYTNTVYLNFKNNYDDIRNSFKDPIAFSQYVVSLFSSDQGDAFSESEVLGEILKASLETDKSFDLPDFDVELTRTILINNLKSFVENNKNEFNKLVFDIYYKIRDSKQGDRVIISTTANEILKDYVIKNQSSYFREWLIRPKYSGVVGPSLSVLEPFIDQYLGYTDFENLLSFQPNSSEILRLQSFFRKFKKNNFIETFYNSSLIEILSDGDTIFLMSPDYPELKRGKSVIRTITTEKAGFSKRHMELIDAEWIAHADGVTLLEAQKGGVYIFKKEFNLTGLRQRIKSSKLFFLVDDYIKFEVNGNLIDNEYTGGGLPRPLEVDVSKFISSEENEVIFFVRNVAGEEHEQWTNVTAEENPYDFIYNLTIELENG